MLMLVDETVCCLHIIIHVTRTRSSRIEDSSRVWAWRDVLVQVGHLLLVRLIATTSSTLILHSLGWLIGLGI